MRFNKSLQIGAKGGHGPIRYFVESYQPGKSIRFRFMAPKGFDGYHEYDIEKSGSDYSILKHTLEMNVSRLTILSWTFVFCPLHDSLIEDSLDKAERNLGIRSDKTDWSNWVKFLRWILNKSGQRRVSS